MIKKKKRYANPPDGAVRRAHDIGVVEEGPPTLVLAVHPDGHEPRELPLRRLHAALHARAPDLSGATRNVCN